MSDGRGAARDAGARGPALLWVQLAIGWLPVWTLFTTLIATAHPESSLRGATLVGLRMVLAAALLAIPVQRLTARLPWPDAVRPRFLAAHLVAAAAFAVSWVTINLTIDHLMRLPGRWLLHYPVAPYLILGVWLYVMVAGIAYAHQTAARAARAETLAARAQLAALRAQLHPHFLFNALHTVVHLIPREPRRAAQAAEQLGELLRVAVDEERDLVPLAEERRFVERYLALEASRFGDRLRTEVSVEPAAEGALLPSFALLTLVENAVRHAAAPRVEATLVRVQARRRGDELWLQVSDDGPGASEGELAGRPGGGLRRLRERLLALYGGAAKLEIATRDATGRDAAPGLTATLVLPAGADAGDPT
jgi:signal transduction histidine kinase